MDLRAWKACHAYKQAVYRACCVGPLSTDWIRRRQIEESVAGPPAHLAEGFGRFSPADFAHYTVIARASLIESQAHLTEAVDQGYIDDAKRLELGVFADLAIREVTGLMDYLRSTAPIRHPRAGKERRMAPGPGLRRERAPGAGPDTGTTRQAADGSRRSGRHRWRTGDTGGNEP
jgi:four helix bundle protein